MKDLQYTATSLSQMSEMYKEAQGFSGRSKEGEKKKAAKTNTVVSTDFSSMTLNTAMTGQQGGGERPPACPQCSMFHGELKAVCPFWDPETKVFKVKNFLKFRSVRQIEGDGSSKINDFWLNKLKTFGFRGMGITQETDKKKIVKDLKDAAAAMPQASVEERRKYAERNKKFMNLATHEEGRSTTDLEDKIEKLTNQVQAMSNPSKKSSKKSKKSGSARKKMKKSKKSEESEDSSSDDSAPDLESDSSSDSEMESS